MRSFIQLYIAAVREFRRDFSALFWTFAFPIIFIVVFGIIFSNEGDISFDLGVVNEDGAASQQLVDGFEGIDAFDVSVGSREDELAALEDGDRSAVIIIPEGTGAALGQYASQVRATGSGADLDQVADAITRAVPGVTAVKSPDLFLSYRQQTGSLLRGITLVMALTWVMAIVAVGLVFSIALNERRREIGMLRALGATRSFVLRSLLAEAGALGLLGALVGIPVALLGTFLFRNLLMSSLEVLFLFPSVTSILVLFIVGLVLAVATVTLAAFIPAYRVSRLDPATAMRD